jgi:hypothetical protein
MRERVGGLLVLAGDANQQACGQQQGYEKATKHAGDTSVELEFCA